MASALFGLDRGLIFPSQDFLVSRRHFLGGDDSIVVSRRHIANRLVEKGGFVLEVHSAVSQFGLARETYFSRVE